MPSTDGKVKFLSVEEVWRLHCDLSEELAPQGVGFVTVVRDRNVLESAVNQPRQTLGGADLYPGIFEKAAASARGIICGHPFLDGNKRTGIASAARMLAINGYRVEMSREEHVALALDIAGDRKRGREPISVEEIAGRLKKAASSETLLPAGFNKT